MSTWSQVDRSGRLGLTAAASGILERIGPPAAYALAALDGRPAAVGRAVAERGWAGVFGMATLPAARRRGAAAAVLAALAGWAADQGAAGVYLQVEPDNPAALALYGRVGFGTLYRYHYRTLDRRSGAGQVSRFGGVTWPPRAARKPQRCRNAPALHATPAL